MAWQEQACSLPARHATQTDAQKKTRTVYALRDWQSAIMAMQPCADSRQVSDTVQHRDPGAHQGHAAALREGGLRGVQRVADDGGAPAPGRPARLRQSDAHHSSLSHDCNHRITGRLPLKQTHIADQPSFQQLSGWTSHPLKAVSPGAEHSVIPESNDLVSSAMPGAAP